VVLTESLGSDVLAHVQIDAPAVLVGEQLDAARELHGGDGNGALPAQARLTARLAPSVPLSTGAPLRLEVDPAGVHLFDPHTELAFNRGAPRRSRPFPRGLSKGDRRAR
jgi:hypothetical protein